MVDAEQVLSAPPSKRQKKPKQNQRDDEYEQYYKLGMTLPQLIHPFLPVDHLLYYGSLLYTQQNSEDADIQVDSEVEMMDSSEKESILQAFTILIERSPWLGQKLEAVMGDENVMHQVERSISNGRSQGHSNDSSCLKSEGLDWVMENLLEPLVPTIPKSRSKSDRGFNHPILARMLCPAVKLDCLENDPDYIKTLRLGNVSHEDWPAFCYEGERCDPEDLEKGLFRGTYLLRTFRRIFTGPKSVTSGKPGPASKRKSVAQIIHMTKVTPRSIAYTAVQARFTLSDKEEWNELDGSFDYRCFYESIIAVFESEPDLPWVKETLQWWNQGENLSSDITSSSPTEPSWPRFKDYGRTSQGTASEASTITVNCTLNVASRVENH